MFRTGLITEEDILCLVLLLLLLAIGVVATVVVVECVWLHSSTRASVRQDTMPRTITNTPEVNHSPFRLAFPAHQFTARPPTNARAYPPTNPSIS